MIWVLVSNRKWYEKNSEKAKEQARKRSTENPEYRTVVHHKHQIFNSKANQHRNYKGTPFFDGWNPDKGGSYQAGADWIIVNLGKRPQGHSLHIVDHAKGFVPDNLEWANQKKQIAEQMFKIIADQKHEIKQLRLRILELENA